MQKNIQIDRTERASDDMNCGSGYSPSVGFSAMVINFLFWNAKKFLENINTF
jgi:hypothetical protein